MNRVSQQAGFLLHRRDYRETSLLLELFTPDHGRVGIIAKGARRSRRGRAGLLQPFQPLLLSWARRGELGVLTDVERAPAPARPFGADRLALGFYLNELVLRLLPRDDPHPALFGHYRRALDELGAGEAALRCFEVALLTELGYGLELVRDRDTGAPLDAEGYYRYDIERGPTGVAEASDSPWVVSGATLLQLADGGQGGEQERQEGRRLMHRILAHYLGERPLRSRELFKKVWRRRL